MKCKLICISQDKKLLREQMHLSINRMRQLQHELGMLDESGFPINIPVTDTPEKLQKLDELHNLILENDRRMLHFFDSEERKQILRSLPSQKVILSEASKEKVNDKVEANNISHEDAVFLAKNYPNVLIHMIENTDVQLSNESIDFISENHLDILLILLKNNATPSTIPAIAIDDLAPEDRPLTKLMIDSDTRLLKEFILGQSNIEKSQDLSLTLEVNVQSAKHLEIIESINEILTRKYGGHEAAQRKIDLANHLIRLYDDFGIDTSDLERTRKALTNEMFEDYIFGDAINGFNMVFTYLLEYFGEIRELEAFDKRNGCSKEKLNPELFTEKNRERFNSYNELVEQTNKIIGNSSLNETEKRLKLIDVYVAVKRLCKRPWNEKSIEDIQKQYPYLNKEQIKSIMIAPTQEDKTVTQLLELKKELQNSQ